MLYQCCQSSSQAGVGSVKQSNYYYYNEYIQDNNKLIKSLGVEVAGAVCYIKVNIVAAGTFLLITFKIRLSVPLQKVSANNQSILRAITTISFILPTSAVEVMRFVENNGSNQ